MRRVVANLFAPLPGPDAPWGEDLRRLHERFGPDTARFVAEVLDGMEVMLLGRAAYESLAGYWPAAALLDEPLAGRMNGVGKLVFSTRLEKPLSWTGAALAGDELVEEVTRLKQQAGGEVGVVGSVRLTRALARAGLLDGYRMLVDAVALGGHRPGPVFEDGDETEQRLVGSRILDSRVVALEYAVAIEGEAAPRPWPAGAGRGRTAAAGRAGGAAAAAGDTAGPRDALPA